LTTRSQKKFEHTHDTDIFRVMGSKVKVTDNISYKCTFPERHTDQRFTIEDELICKIFLLISAFLYEIIAVFVFFCLGAKSVVCFCLISVVDVASTLGLSKFQQFCM